MELARSISALRELNALGRSPQETFTPFEGRGYHFPALTEFLNRAPISIRSREIRCSTETEDRFLASTDPQVVQWSRRELRELCWSRRVCSDPRFLSLIGSRAGELRSSAIKGLVFYLQHNWPSAASSAFATSVRTLVQRNVGSNAVLRRWWEQKNYVLDDRAAQNLGKRIAVQQILPGQLTQELYLFPSTEFLAQALGEACEQCFQLATLNASQLPFLLSLLSDPTLPKESCCSFLSRLIVHPAIGKEESSRDLITAFMLTDPRFGDPRLRAEQWFAISADAQRAFVSWLTHQDIELFFNLIVDDRNDVHGRKAFWLQYASKAIRSRSILCPDDLTRHRAKIGVLREDGKLVGEFRRGNTSAFIMDFGTVIAVEFSRVGNALFLYPPEAFAEVLPDFWRSVVSPDSLKLRGRTLRDGWITHRDNWPAVARRVLAKERVTRG